MFYNDNIVLDWYTIKVATLISSGFSFILMMTLKIKTYLCDMIKLAQNVVAPILSKVTNTCNSSIESMCLCFKMNN